MSYSVDPTNTVSFPSNQDGRRVYIMKNPKKTLAPGDKWAFSLNIAVDPNSAEIVSNFTVSATVTKNNIPRTLFSDTSTNVGASDMTTRSLPLWSENDAYVGWGAEKNTTNSTDYVESRLGASSFNVL